MSRMHLRAGFLPALAVGVVLLSTHPVHAINLIFNPGFETGDFTGWSNLGTATVGSAPHTGDFGAVLSGRRNGGGDLSQFIGTVPSSTYDLDFWVAGNGRSPQFFTAYWDGSPVLNLTIDGFHPYTEYTFIGLVASGGATQVKFSYSTSDGGFTLDDVSVDGIPGTPEPTTLLLLGPGLALLVARRRKKA